MYVCMSEMANVENDVRWKDLILTLLNQFKDNSESSRESNFCLKCQQQQQRKKGILKAMVFF